MGKKAQSGASANFPTDRWSTWGSETPFPQRDGGHLGAVRCCTQAGCRLSVTSSSRYAPGSTCICVSSEFLNPKQQTPRWHLVWIKVLFLEVTQVHSRSLSLIIIWLQCCYFETFWLYQSNCIILSMCNNAKIKPLNIFRILVFLSLMWEVLNEEKSSIIWCYCQ